jgi:large subunit ribosomal protein L20
MARVKRGVIKHAKHKKILSMAKGYRGRAGSCYRIAHERVEKGLQYAYRDRRKKKTTFRQLWITRINAAAREMGITYSQLMNGFKKAGIELDRKVLSAMAIDNRDAFAAAVESAKRFIGTAPKKAA